jgi:MFS family permease
MSFFSQKRKLGRTAFLPHTPLFRVQANARGRIMASSLQPQLQMLISENDYCGNLSTSYLRSILDSAYAFGGTAGIFWGYLADRMGRRRVTLMGLWAMFVCCLSMGFATNLASCTIFRYFAGLASSTVGNAHVRTACETLLTS